MTVKETALKTLNELPEDATWEDIKERINFVMGIQLGLNQLDAGKGIPHSEIKSEFVK